MNILNKTNEKGFSLIEAMVALAIFLIAALGVFATFSYTVLYNSGNGSRAQALSILQQEVELMRSAKFTPTATDSNLTGGVKAVRTIVAPDGNRYKIQITVDDDPFTTGVQTDNTKTLKEVTVTVSLDRPTPGWQTSVPIKAVLRRVRAN